MFDHDVPYLNRRHPVAPKAYHEKVALQLHGRNVTAVELVGSLDHLLHRYYKGEAATNSKSFQYIQKLHEFYESEGFQVSTQEIDGCTES